VALRVLRAATGGALLLTGLVAAAPLQGGARPTLAALAMIAHGEWQLRERDPNAQARRLCLNDPATLIQLQHSGEQCSQFVVENSRLKATVHYTCAGHGYGRTTVSVETPRLFRIESQGIRDGLPFALDMEARRIGDCAR